MGGDHDSRAGGDDDPFAEGRAYPSTVDDIDEWRITLDWEVIDGRIEPVGIHIRSTSPGTPVPTGIARILPIGDVIRRQRTALTDAAIARTTTRVSGMRRSTLAGLKAVADVYRAAWERGDPPTRAVADELGINYGAASNRVARARAAGLLPWTSQGAPQA